ncbi:MAG: chemotaxis protein CheW [Desulfovibrio sp.]|uniref:chemotaxis protein CheW n=1 Tax=Desulfovibrio sp. 7SRBS1 TaxID=3378064 RepID=UPI003B3E2BC5
MKTPEEYFQEKVELPGAAVHGGSFTDAEKAFIEKYLGLENKEALARIPRHDPRGEDAVAGFGPRGDSGGGEDDELEARLRTDPELQLVSFMVGEQEYALPIKAIQEVIKYVPPTRLPKAPLYVEGVINLRGRVTPLVSMRSIMATGDVQDDRFIIVCRFKGLQIGLMVTAIVTMYRALQEQIEWSIEASVGINASFLSGLMKSGEKLVNIISVERLVTSILSR